MIAREVQCGRMDAARRRRIVRYAAQLGLSAVEAGEMIEACREEAARSDDPRVRGHALRLVEAPQTMPLSTKLGLTFLGALMVHWVLRLLN